MINLDRVIKSFHQYLECKGLSISQQRFIIILDDKLGDRVLFKDSDALILPTNLYSPIEADGDIKNQIRNTLRYVPFWDIA